MNSDVYKISKAVNEPIKDYESAIQKFDNKTLQQMSKNCKKLVDGKGANRVVNEILLL